MVFETERVPAPSAPDRVSAHASQRLQAYVPRMLIDWLRTTPNQTYQEINGTLVFVDISGFTALTERLARHGKVGAEEMSGTLDAMFTALLDVAYQDGAGLVKWGGDAVLLLFDGPAHAPRACRAAHRMRATLRERGRLDTSAGRVTLRMSVGIHSGDFHFFLVGDPDVPPRADRGRTGRLGDRGHGGDRRRRRDRHQPPDGGAAASVLRRAAQGCGAAAALGPGRRDGRCPTC